MAYESHYWRKIIKKEAVYLKKKLKLSHKDIEDNIDEHFSYVEIKIMTLAYIARKLADSHKLPDNTLQRKVELIIHPVTGKLKSFFDFEGEYDLVVEKNTELKIRDICNQIIHSYVLQAVGNRTKAFKYFWFVSDTNKNKGLYKIEIDRFIKIMLEIANSEVMKMTMHYDKKTGKRVYTHE